MRDLDTILHLKNNPITSFIRSMNISSSPTPYSSVVGQLTFSLEGLDPQEVSVIEVINADNGTTLGRIRCTGLAERKINVAPYFRRLFELGMVPNTTTSVLVFPYSLFNCAIRCGDTQSPAVPLVMSAPAFAPIAERTLLSELPLHRTIAPGEFDILTTISPDGMIEAEFTLSGTEGQSSSFSINSTEAERMLGIGVDYDSLKQRAGYDLAGIEVSLLAGGQSVAVVEYEVVTRGRETCRLVWANRYGAAELFTFEPVVSIRSVADRPVDREASSDVVASETRTLTLDSGICPRQLIEALSGILSSPFVYRLAGGKAHDVRVCNSECTIAEAGKPSKITVQISTTEKAAATI